MDKVGELIALRTKMGMNRKEFCEYFLIPYRTMVDWEYGKNSIPEYLLRLMVYKAYAENMCDEYRMLNRKLVDLEMANKRDHKVEITDEAINKVPFIKYPEINPIEYDVIQKLAKQTLSISKNKNDSNEVAVTYSLDTDGKNEERVGVAMGFAHEVDPLEDSTSYHIITTGKMCTVLLMHNHPSLSDFSMSDIHYLLMYGSIKMIIVVTNLGKISYLIKSEKYEYGAAVDLFNKALEIHNRARNLKGLKKASDLFLHNCTKVGIIYDDR